MKNILPRTKLAGLLATVCLGLAPAAFALDPPPDGGYPNQTTAEGDNALSSLTTGFANTAIGSEALLLNTTGFQNTACGAQALISNTTGNNNTVIGAAALKNNTTGSDNTVNGSEALASNTTGNFNTATGGDALISNTTGSNNTANGGGALFFNTTGVSNTANGVDALFNNTTGSNNTADGSLALVNSTTGINNAATGFQALQSNTTGNYNTASGQGALYGNTSGNNNTAVGQNALRSNTTGKNNIALGSNAGINLTTGSNNIDIVDKGLVGEANTIRIGKQGTQQTTYIAGISGKTIAGGVNVVIDTTGHLGTVVSSARFKDAIQPMDKASEAILTLQPVTFRYKKELDSKGIPQFGLVAEQVEKVDPDLVARDETGKPYTVRYEAVNAMLLNEFLKEHRKVADQSDQIAELKATVADLKSALKAQATQIQKVSDQLRAHTPRVVAND